MASIGVVQAIGRCADGVSTVHICEILHEGDYEAHVPADEIIEACRKQAVLIDVLKRPEPEKELRLRKLVAVIMDMKALGLIE